MAEIERLNVRGRGSSQFKKKTAGRDHGEMLGGGGQKEEM